MQEHKEAEEVHTQKKEDEGVRRKEEPQDEECALDAFTLSNCLLKAANFAATKHRMQRRKDKDRKFQL